MAEYIYISSDNWYFHLIIGILLFILFKWLIGKFIKKGKLKIFLTFISTLIFTPIIYYLFVVTSLSITLYEYHPESKFDSKKWTENVEDRHEMRKDLIDSKILIGKTKKEVIEILGIPQNINKVNNDTIKNWTYFLGSEGHGMGWKFHYLNLDFTNGKVEKVENNEFID